MGRDRGPNKLTTKEQKFVNLWFEKGNKTDAYKGSYSTKNMKEDTIRQKAVRLSQKDNIVKAYEVLANKHKEKALWTREMAVESLQKAMVICTEDRTMSPFISAIKELNLLEDLYPKRDNININVDANSANIDSIKNTMSKLKGVKR